MQEDTEDSKRWTTYPQIGIDHMLHKVSKVLISGIGGGGDVLTALHVRWALEKVAPHVKWVQGGVTGGPVSHYDDIIEIDDHSAWVTEKSRGKPPHRLIEAIVAGKIKENVFLLSCDQGVKNMVNSLDAVIESEKIEMMIFIDGGTDSLAFLGSSVASPTEDTMALAAVGLGAYSDQLKYRVIGVSVVGSDGEMMLEEISQQLLKLSMEGGYVGGTFFPVERLSEYAELLSEVLQNYPTATAQAPVLATSTPFTDNLKFPFKPISNGFQLASFLFDARVTAEVGNAFTHLAFEMETRKDVSRAIFNLLHEYRFSTKAD